MSFGNYPLHPTLSGNHPLPESVDIVIAGSGIMGAAAAFYLRQRGLSVLVCDKAGIASQQSTRAWGFVRQQARDPAEVPLMMAAIPLWESLESTLQQPLEWRQGGSLWLANTESQLQDYQNWLNVAHAHGLGTRILTPAEVRERLPALTDPGHGALFTANDGQAEPRRVAPAFALRSAEQGALFVEGCGVTGIDCAGGAVCGVQTERGYVKTRRLLVAAGASTWRLLATQGLDLPQQSVRCTVSRTSAGPQVGAQSFIGHGVGFRQRADGSFNIADEAQADIDLNLGYLRAARWYLPLLPEHHKSFRFRLNGSCLRDMKHRLTGLDAVLGERDPHVPPAPDRVSRAEATLRGALPGLANVRVVESWAGQIDVLPDGIPVLDAPTQINGLLVATGFCGHGFALGPIVGQQMAQWADEGRTDINMAAFRLGRFADGTAGKPYSLF
jgi:glycine/D-amino acid oxidase-like deaminating enzyme